MHDLYTNPCRALIQCQFYENPLLHQWLLKVTIYLVSIYDYKTPQPYLRYSWIYLYQLLLIKQLHIFRMDMWILGSESDGGEGDKAGGSGSGKSVVGSFSMASCSSKVQYFLDLSSVLFSFVSFLLHYPFNHHNCTTFFLLLKMSFHYQIFN